jgi:hypothetical protein
MMIGLASVREVADQMKAARAGHGSTILYENYTYRKGVARQHVDVLPGHWKFSAERLSQLLDAAG